MNDPRINLAALLLRLTLGTMFVAHGLLKYFVFTPAGTVKFFESLGLPGPLAYLTIAAEVLGGIALLVGYHTRVVASALVPVLLGAAWAHAGNGWLFSSPNGGRPVSTKNSVQPRAYRSVRASAEWASAHCSGAM